MKACLLLTLASAVGASSAPAADDFRVGAADAVARARAAAPSTASAIYTAAPNDTALFYSPYAWSVNATSASTINSAAYIRVLFTGAWANLSFDVSSMVNPPSQLYCRIDNGPLTPYLVAPLIALSVPVNLTHGDVPYHLLEVMVKSTTETANRWQQGVPSTKVVFTGLSVEGALAQWLPAPRNILIYGDSITEGVLTLGGSQHYDTDHNDAVRAAWRRNGPPPAIPSLTPHPPTHTATPPGAQFTVWSFNQGRLLGAEVGVIGFGATGLSRGGSGGVPPLGVSWNQLWDGAPRAFTPPPDLVVFNEGTNDCRAPPEPCGIAPQMAAVLSSVLAACPAAAVAVLQPFNGAATDALLAAIATVNSPRVTFVNTTGFYNTALGGGLHPTGPNDVARIAPQVAAQLRPLLK